MSDKTVISDTFKDAHDHLKAGIEEMKCIGDEPPMSIYKAMHALTHALTEVNERIHYAEGTAALAMKHRDEAEKRASEFFDEAAAQVDNAMRAENRLAEANQIIHDLTNGITGTLQKDEIESLRLTVDGLQKEVTKSACLLAEAQIALEAPTKEEIALRAQLTEARKALKEAANWCAIEREKLGAIPALECKTCGKDRAGVREPRTAVGSLD